MGNCKKKERHLSLIFPNQGNQGIHFQMTNVSSFPERSIDVKMGTLPPTTVNADRHVYLNRIHTYLSKLGRTPLLLIG